MYAVPRIARQYDAARCAQSFTPQGLGEAFIWRARRITAVLNCTWTRFSHQFTPGSNRHPRQLAQHTGETFDRLSKPEDVSFLFLAFLLS